MRVNFRVWLIMRLCAFVCACARFCMCICCFLSSFVFVLEHAWVDISFFCVWDFVCMNICLCACVCLYVYVYVCLRVFVCACMCMCVYISACVCFSVSVCVCVCVRAYVLVYVFGVSMCERACVGACVHAIKKTPIVSQNVHYDIYSVLFGPKFITFCRLFVHMHFLTKLDLRSSFVSRVPVSFSTFSFIFL